MNEEMLDVVDADGNVLRTVPRSEVHGNPELMHRVVHVLVFNPEGELYLQKRSMNKDVAPGRWDTSVGGHVEAGESIATALGRECAEELGITGAEFEFLYTYIHSNPYETELVHTHRIVHGGDITFNRQEIDTVRPWSIGEIEAALDGDMLSDNFKHEFRTYLNHIGRRS